MFSAIDGSAVDEHVPCFMFYVLCFILYSPFTLSPFSFILNFMTLSEIKTFKDTLKDEMRAKSLTIGKLSELTGIAIHHIAALVESDFAHLPAAPYVRGYLQKIAEVLDIDFDMLWRRYERESAIKRSGEKDTLPQNRFALRSIKKSSLIIAAIIIVALVIGLPALANFFGKPSLEVISPAGETEIVSERSYHIIGKVQDPKDRVFINDTEIQVQPDGSFDVPKELDPDANTFVVSAKRFLGRETTITRNVFYKPNGVPSLESATSSASSTLEKSSATTGSTTKR